MERQTAAAGDDEGSASGLHQTERRGSGEPAHLSAVRPERHRVLRLHPAHRLLRRRPVPGPLHVHRRLQSSPRPTAALRRQHSGGTADHGRVGALRAGQRIAKSAGLRGARLGRGHQRGHGELVQRISAVHLSGRGLPQLRRPGAVSFEPPGHHHRHAARRARHAEGPERGAPGANRRCGDRFAHRFLRAGIPHAGGRAGAARFLQGVARDAGLYGIHDPRRLRSSPSIACWRAAWWSAACAS
jgi:hypothetical protein